MKTCMPFLVHKMIPLLCLLVLAPGLPGVHAELVGSPGAIRVLQQDTHGVMLEFRMPAFTVDPTTAGARVEIQGWTRTTQPGAVDLPFTASLLELPPATACTAEVLEVRESRMQIDALARVPDPRDQAFGLAGLDAAPVGMDQIRPDPQLAVRIEKSVVIRGASFVRMLIYPFSWDEDAGTVIYWETALIRIDFGTEGPNRAIAERKPATVGSAALPDARSTYPSGPRVRIEVTEDGFYEVSSSELQRLGFPASRLSPRNLQLWNYGRQIAFTLTNVQVSRRRVSFVLRFYATSTDSPFTGTNVYWLCSDSSGGKRISSRNASPQPLAPVQTWFDEIATRAERHLMWEGTPLAPDVNYWFWEKLTAPVTKTYSIGVANPADEGGQASLKIWFRGRSTDAKSPDHRVRILWDNTPLGDAAWDGTEEYCAELPLTKGQASAGNHNVTLSLPGDTGAAVDVLYLDRFELHYGRQLDSGNADLRFRIQTQDSRTLELLTSAASASEIYDVTDPASVVRLEGVVTQSQADRRLYRFRHLGGAPATYYGISQSQVKSPTAISYWQPEGLRRNQNQADYLIVAPREFQSALERLRSHREGQGLRSRIVATEEIFNEFSHGFPEPSGIRQFLDYAYHNWLKPAPLYVLLVGDANVDYRDYLKTGKQGKVPVHMSWTSILGLAPDDHWYATIDGDDPLPDLIVGRLPGATAARVAEITGKIIDFERSGGKASPLAVAAADNGESIWEETSDKLVSILPPYFVAEKIYLRLMTASNAKTALLGALSKGPSVVTYVGHGAVLNWAGEFILESGDVPKIANTAESLSFVVSLNCLNAYFAQPFYYSLGEELVAAPGKAALACFAPSALSFPSEHQVIGVELFNAIFKDHQLRIGNAVIQAKINGYARGVIDETLLMFTLLGDPASRLKEW